MRDAVFVVLRFSDGVGQERERVKKEPEMQFILDSGKDCPVSKQDMNYGQKKDHIYVRASVVEMSSAIVE